MISIKIHFYFFFSLACCVVFLACLNGSLTLNIRTNADQSPYRRSLSIIYKSRTHFHVVFLRVFVCCHWIGQTIAWIWIIIYIARVRLLCFVHLFFSSFYKNALIFLINVFAVLIFILFFSSARIWLGWRVCTVQETKLHSRIPIGHCGAQWTRALELHIQMSMLLLLLFIFG